MTPLFSVIVYGLSVHPVYHSEPEAPLWFGFSLLQRAFVRSVCRDSRAVVFEFTREEKNSRVKGPYSYAYLPVDPALSPSPLISL